MRGVIAAIATPVSNQGEPDHGRFVDHARFLLSNGADGLNVLGTTGEATSFTVATRLKLMKAAASALPVQRLMVGTGAAAVEDATVLTQAAVDAGFAGVLVLPPFYYKGVQDDGLVAFVDALNKVTDGSTTSIYLYHFPQMTGIGWSADLIRRLRANYGGRIAGLKDSSGDLANSRAIAALDPRFAVFPSNEETLLDARRGMFAGCISATANLNSGYCAKAWANGDESALAKAVAIRALFNGKPLVAGVKAALAQLTRDAEWANVMVPLTPWSDEDRSMLARNISAIVESDAFA